MSRLEGGSIRDDDKGMVGERDILLSDALLPFGFRDCDCACWWGCDEDVGLRTFGIKGGG